MKKSFIHVLIMFSFSLSLHAQEVIIGAPLSSEEQPGRPLVRDGEKPVGTLVPAEAEINPADGQLKLDPVTNSKEEKAVEQAEAQKKADDQSPYQAPAEVSPALPMYSQARPFIPQKYLQFAFGYLDSRWEKVHNSLDNGSILTDFKVVSDMNKHVQMGFGIEVVSDTSEQTIPDNIRVLQYKLFADYHAPLFMDRLDWMAGIGLSIGDYSIRRLSLNAAGEEVNTKIKSGTIYGVIPKAGIRFYLVEKNSIDLAVEYHQYFSTPQRFISGFAFVPQFSFLF